MLGDIMQLKNLTMSFGTQTLFKDVNLNIGEKEKIGIVGVNGAGKTTFFKIIMGILKLDKGKIVLDKDQRIEWLPQVIDEEVPSLDITVFDFLFSGRPIEKLEKRLKDAFHK